jgi:large subunit ribosomal protein L10
MKTKAQKQVILENLSQDVQKQQSMVFVDYKGLTVPALEKIRQQLKEVGAKFQVVKKTLFERTLTEQGITGNIKEKEGQLAVVFSFEDALVPVKKIYEFTKEFEQLKIVGGYAENQVQTAEVMTQFAQVPSREELLGRLVGSIASPMTGFVTVLQGNIKGLITVLSEKAKT